MALSDFVSVTVSLSSANVTREGFGVPLILAYDLPVGFNTGTTRSYSSDAGLVADFPSASSPTANAAAKIFAQDPCPPLIKVGGGALPPTQEFSLVPTGSVVTGQVWNFLLDGQLVTFTVGGTQTIAAVVAGLVAAAEALSLEVTVANVSSTSLTITANSAGAFHAVSVTPAQSTTLAVSQIHTDPGVATDLNAIFAYDNSWYALDTLFNSKACVVAADGWVETNKRLYVAQTQDTAVINVSEGSDSTSVAAALKASDATRTALIWKEATDDFADAAWLGAVLPLTPGSETWAFKQLVDVQTDPLSETQHLNAKQKYCNTYETISGVNITSELGATSGNEYIDVVRFIDSIIASIQEDILAALASNPKIPFTDQGASVIQGIILADLKAGENAGGFAKGSSSVIVPLIANVSSGNVAARNLAPVTFSATLAGAIQAMQIAGTVVE